MTVLRDKLFKEAIKLKWVFPHSSVGKESTCNAGDPGWIPGSGGSTGEGIGNPLQYSWASLVVQPVKNPPAMRETWVWPWVGKTSWRRDRLPTPVFWPWRVARSGHEWATFTFTFFQVKMRSLGWALIQHGWCLYKKEKFRHRQV